MPGALLAHQLPKTERLAVVGSIGFVRPMSHLLLFKSGRIEATDGALYGTTQSGGSVIGTNCPFACELGGTIFKLNKAGTDYTVLYQFSGQGDGAKPRANLVEGSDRWLYGTAGRGAGFQGTVYKLKRDGSNFTVIHSFGSVRDDGAFPASGLLKASDGALYGTTQTGGSWGYGTVFRLHEDGSHYTVLRSFTSQDFSVQPPPEMSSIAILQDGTARLRVGGLSKNSVTIQRSTNLFDWTDLVAGTTTDGAFSFDSPNRGGEQCQFYRAKLGQ